MPAAKEREKLEGTSCAELLRRVKMGSKEFTYYSPLDRDLFFFNMTQNHAQFFFQIILPTFF